MTPPLCFSAETRSHQRTKRKREGSRLFYAPKWRIITREWQEREGTLFSFGETFSIASQNKQAEAGQPDRLPCTTPPAGQSCAKCGQRPVLESDDGDAVARILASQTASANICGRASRSCLRAQTTCAQVGNRLCRLAGAVNAQTCTFSRSRVISRFVCSEPSSV